jgi:hypothetical protein
MKASSSVVAPPGAHERCRGAGGEHATRVHERDPVAALALVHEVGGNEDGDTVPAREVRQQLPEPVSRNRVHTGGGLVEDQDLGAVHRRHRQGQALPDADRQRLGRCVRVRLEREPPQQSGDALAGAGRGQPEQAGVQIEVLADGQLTVEREALGHVADPAPEVRVARVHRSAEQARLALGGRQQAGQHLHRRRLPAAVGAEESKDLAPLDPEADVIHGGESAEAPREPGRLNGGLAVGGPARGDGERPVAAPPGLGQQRDEGGVQVARGGEGHQRVGRAGGQDPPGVHGGDPLEPRRLLHVGGGDQDAHPRPPAPDAGEQLPELAAREGIDAGGRLVQDQEVGIVDERAAEPELLLHAARELAGRPVTEGREPGAGQQLLDAPPALGARLAEQATEEIDVVEDRQRRVEIAPQSLGHVGDAERHGAPDPARAHVAAQHLHGAVADRPGAGDQAEQGRLAHAVGTDQAGQAAAGNVQVEGVERLDVAVPVAESPEPGSPGRCRRHRESLTRRCSGHSARASRRT